MPHIFRFHEGRNNNIYDWKMSDRIMPADVRKVMDQTNVLSSGAGTSIPTPIARMYLFKTAFEIIAAQVRDSLVDENSIYAGLVSETLDLLELLYKSGSDESKFRYHKWIFDNSQNDDDVILGFFGLQHGHRLLAESFKQAAAQAPFNGRIEITLIYYREGEQEILLGGTSPFTFVFTSPNFKRKLRDRGFKTIPGLVSDDFLFDADYKQLHQRDEAFIKYVESLISTEGISNSFAGITEYTINTRNRHHSKFNGRPASLADIQFADIPVTVSNVPLKHLSQESYVQTINQSSDFKIELPEDSYYKRNTSLIPLFLLDKMTYDGQYSSKSSCWSPNTRVSDKEYSETSIDEILNRDLPGLTGFHYPFFSSFDFFENSLIMFPGYTLNDDRFVCIMDAQPFLFPIKPIFFHLFPMSKIGDYLSVENKNDQITFILKIPVYGPTKGRRQFVCKKTYDSSAIIQYSGIIGIYPFTRARQRNLLYTNKYTVASNEKTNAPVAIESIKFIKDDGIKTIVSPATLRSNYADLNTKTTYFEINESFDVIQLNFKKDASAYGGLIIPKFREVENGTEEYVYSIDFGTSNTHVEYSHVIDDDAKDTRPFEITEENMQITLLNKPVLVKENDGAIQYNDYQRSLGLTIDTANQTTLREFVPFQLGPHKGANFKFPFRTATFESRGFKDAKEKRLFFEANIGFNIEPDTLLDDHVYQTDIKWQLESRLNDDDKRSRVSIFFRQLLLMIRTHALLHKSQSANIDKLKIAMSFPTSMDQDLKGILLASFKAQMKDILNIAKDEDFANRLIEVNESIAPYYHLLKEDKDIQNDIYCNVDIGGGTSDIVIVKKTSNILNCYCISIKFAGKQLWGSISDDYDPNDNGFILFYKKFLQTKDVALFGEIKKLLESKKKRTEDIVSYLFSKDEYKFRQIFTECKELKVPLLLHYAATLFYISRLCKVRNIELPKTVSFSGKGSEYLSILFSSDEHLKQFTKKALSIFSGLPSHFEFKIKKSAEPKVITAKGAVIYAAKPLKKKEVDLFGNEDVADNTGELQINPELMTFYGFKDHELEAADRKYHEFEEPKQGYENIILSCVDFLNTFFGNAELVKGSEAALNITDLKKYKDFFLNPSSEFNVLKNGALRNSFKSALEKKKMTSTASDSPFFFAFNTTLIQLSKEIAQQNK